MKLSLPRERVAVREHGVSEKLEHGIGRDGVLIVEVDCNQTCTRTSQSKYGEGSGSRYQSERHTHTRPRLTNQREGKREKSNEVKAHLLWRSPRDSRSHVRSEGAASAPRSEGP